jgi:hypothetical protein
MATGPEAWPSNVDAKPVTDGGKLTSTPGGGRNGVWATANPASQQHKQKILRNVRCIE